MNNKNTTKIKSFVLYADYEKHISKLNNEQRGMLLTAMFNYFNDGVISVVLDPATEMLMSVIAAQMDRDRKKYEEISEKNRLNGIKGAEAKRAKAAAAGAKTADGTNTEADEATAYVGNHDEANADFSDIDDELDAIFEQKHEKSDTFLADFTTIHQAVADFAGKYQANQAYNNNDDDNKKNNNNKNNNINDNNDNNDNNIINSTNTESRLKEIYARLNGAQ